MTKVLFNVFSELWRMYCYFGSCNFVFPAAAVILFSSCTIRREPCKASEVADSEPEIQNSYAPSTNVCNHILEVFNQALEHVRLGQVDQAHRDLEEGSSMMDKYIPPDFFERGDPLCLQGQVLFALGKLDAAEEAFKRSLEAMKYLPTDSFCLEQQYLFLSEIALNRSSFMDSIKWAEKADASGNNNPGRGYVARIAVLDKLAAAQLGLRKYTLAEKLARESLAIREQWGAVEKTGRDLDSFSVTITLARALNGNGRYLESERICTRALDEIRRPPNRSDILILSEISLVNEYLIALINQGMIAEASNELTAGKQRFIRAYNERCVPTGYAYLIEGKICELQGMDADATNFFERAATCLREKCGNHHPLTVESVMARIHTSIRLGEFCSAEILLRDLRTLTASSPDTAELSVADITEAEGLLFMSNGDPETAVDRYRIALNSKAAELPSEHPGIAVLLLRLASALKSSSAHNDEISQVLRRAEHISSRSGNPYLLIECKAALASHLEEQGNLREATELYDVMVEAIDIVYCRTWGGGKNERQEMLNKYLNYYQAALQTAVELALSSPGKKEQERVVSILSRGQSRIFNEMLRQGTVKAYKNDPEFNALLSQWRTELLDKWQSEYNVNQAKPRLNVLQDSALLARAGDHQIFFHENRIRDLKQKLKTMPAGAVIKSIEAEIAESQKNLNGLKLHQDVVGWARTTQTELENQDRLNNTLLTTLEKITEDKLWKRYPRFMELNHPRPVTLDRVQREILKPGELVLMFALFDETSAIIAVDHDTVELHQVDMGRQEVLNIVRRIRSGLTSGADAAALRNLDPADLHKLYSLFVEPVKELLKNSARVFVIPDGPLFIVPFEMFVCVYGQKEKHDFIEARAASTGKAEHLLLQEYDVLQFLGNQQVFTYLPSMDAFASLRLFDGDKPSEYERQLVAVADPVFDVESVNFPSFPKGLLPEGVVVKPRGLTSVPLASSKTAVFPRLSATAEEALAVASIVGEPYKLLLRYEAQEYAIKHGGLLNSRYLLFATHGLLGGEYLKLSELMMNPHANATSPVKKSSVSLKKERTPQPSLILSLSGDMRGEDGILTLDEITYELDISAELAVLSACNSAGETDEACQGEGFAGLARGFMYAGCRNLLVSHWSIDDNSSRDLITAFFEFMHAGDSLDQALMQARQCVRDVPLVIETDSWGALHVSRSHPYFWAPFVHIGEK